MFRKLIITLICIGTICFGFTMVTTGDEKTGEETIQLPVPSTTKKEDIKLPEDSEEKDASAPDKINSELTSDTEEAIQLSVPSATKKEEIKLPDPEDNEKKDVSGPEETTQSPLPSATKKEEIKLPGENKKKDASSLEKTTIELTTGTGVITPESQGGSGDGTSVDRQVQVITKYLKRNELHVYNLPNLKAGETLYVYVERISGNLDPFTGIAGVAFDAARALKKLAKIKDVKP